MNLSLQPDPWMRWLYDPPHPDYQSEHAHALRASREAAVRNASQWMKDCAAWNEAHTEGGA